MSDIDNLGAELDALYDQWNLEAIPFAQSATKLRERLHQVFTGRDVELRQVLTLLRGDTARSVLLYGWIGIGKTAFILEVLAYLQRQSPNHLVAYINLQPGMDLATAALIALAQALDDRQDPSARQLLTQLGIPTDQPAMERSRKAGGQMVFAAELSERAIPLANPTYPTVSFEMLLERALKTHKSNKVVIAIDDLDKQDPAQVRQLLLNAQGLLKGNAYFFLTGHPAGITRDYLIADRGIFDLAVELKQLDQDTSYRMLSRYLSSMRKRPVTSDPDDLNPVHPFSPEAARALCLQADGVPRWLNRIGQCVLSRALELAAPRIDLEVLNQGLDYTRAQLKGQRGLVAQDYYLLELVMEKRVLSNRTLSMEDLERLQAREFSEILPILDKLVEYDLLRRLPSERAVEYAPIPLLMPDNDLNPES